MKNQANVKIDFTYLDVQTCFKDFYVIPDYQREYVWGELQVNQLLTDVYDQYSTNSGKEYFIGSTVVFRNSEGQLEIIDGQQRTTTLFLILCGFKKIYLDRSIDTSLIERMIKDKTLNSKSQIVDQYKLILQYKDSSNAIVNISSMSPRPKVLTGSSVKLHDAFDFVVAFLNEKFESGNDEELQWFFGYIYQQLKFIQIQTPEINDALRIFETINERGIGLNPMDLLKNLIFRQVERAEFTMLNKKWQDLISILNKSNEKPLRFLRYFLMANYKIKSDNGDEILREDEIYTWITKPENAKQIRYTESPFDFVDLLLDNAKLYAALLKGQDLTGDNIHLLNIKQLGGGSFRQHLILFLAARHLPISLLNHLAKQIETLVFYYFITKEPTKEFERNFSRWAKDILEVKDEKSLNNFLENRIQPEIEKRINNYKQSFLSLNQTSIQQYRVRYIISKIAQYIDQQRMGVNEYQFLEPYLDIKLEIEHILPYNPDNDLRNSIGDDYDQLKIMLGNLTLIEKTINASMGNKGFYEYKGNEYLKSLYYITKSIVKTEDVGSNTSVNRFNKKLKSFTQWNGQSISDRQEMLYNLSKEIWSVKLI